MLNSNSFFLHYHCNHTEKHLHCDLSLSSISSKKELQLIRVDSEFSIHFIRNLFGTTFGIGIRNRAPNRGGQPVSMHCGDVVNLVEVMAGIGIVSDN